MRYLSLVLVLVFATAFVVGCGETPPPAKKAPEAKKAEVPDAAKEAIEKATDAAKDAAEKAGAAAKEAIDKAAEDAKEADEK